MEPNSLSSQKASVNTQNKGDKEDHEVHEGCNRIADGELTFREIGQNLPKECHIEVWILFFEFDLLLKHRLILLVVEVKFAL